MKNIAWSILVLMLLITGCRKDNQDILLSIPLIPLDFEIPPTANPFQTHYFNLSSVPSNSLALFDGANIDETDPNIIVLPGEARMNSLFADVDYEFIQSMSLRLCENGDTNQNCGTEIFWRQPVPFQVGSVVDLIPSNIDVKEWLLEENVNIQVKLETLRNNPPQFVESRLEIEFHVK